MRKGWQKVELIKVCEEITDGSHFSPKSYDSGRYPYITVRDIENDTVNFNTCKFIGQKDYEILLKNGCKPNYGDILFSKDGTVGKVSLIDFEKEFVVLSSLAIIRPNQNFINSRFLKYILKNPVFLETAIGHKTGVAIKRIILKNLKQIEIQFPESLSEQKRIVAILDEAFAAIDKAKANTEKNLQSAKELFESYLQNLFANPGEDWEKRMLKEIGVTQTGTTPKTSDKKNYGYYIPFIKPSDIDIPGNGEIRYDNEGLSEQGLNNGRKMLKGSTLMVCIGATIGKVGFIDRDVSCNQQINSLTVKEEFSPKFAYYALSTKDFFEQVMHNAAQATLPIINKGKWETLKICYPKSKEKQDAIVSKLDYLSTQTKKLETNYQQKLNVLEDLKKSILHKAFSGELTEKAMDAV
jgi:type I restriction enzyme, S subunit